MYVGVGAPMAYCCGESPVWQLASFRERVLGNSLAYVLILTSSIRGMLRMRRDMYQSRLTWEDGLTPVALRPPAHPSGWHCLSSELRTAEEM